MAPSTNRDPRGGISPSAGGVVTKIVVVLVMYTLCMTTAMVEVAISKGSLTDTLSAGEVETCDPASYIYEWRNVGWGSNMNRILALWVREIEQGRDDFALDVTQLFLKQIKCPSEPEAIGWRCLFKPMARLCTFQDQQEFYDFLVARYKAEGGQMVSNSAASAVHLGKVEAAAAVLGFLYSNAQPWFTEDVESILQEEAIAPVRSGKFVAIHVRRGDKIILGEAARIEVPAYLEAAASHLALASKEQPGAASADSITGLWVSSDDSRVLSEVQDLAPSYFTNVSRDRIVSVSFRTDAPHKLPPGIELPTTTNQMTYELWVGLHAELKMLSEAEAFVGTFSSNIARLVYVMREINGRPRASTLSVDDPIWHLG